MRGSALVVFLLLAAVLTIPGSTSAAQVPLRSFEGHVVAVETSNATGDNPNLAIITGQAEVTGSAAGLFFFTQVRSFRIEAVDRLEVFDTAGGAASVDPDEYRRTGRPIHQAHHNATLTLSTGARIVLQADDAAWALQGAAPFAFGIPIDPPETIGEGPIQVRTNTSLALVGETTLSGTLDHDTEDTFLFSPDRNATITVTSDEAPSGVHFTGKDYLHRLLRHAELDADCDLVLVPLTRSVEVSFRPAPRSVANERFDLEAINDAVAEIGDTSGTNGTFQVPTETRDLIQSLNPVFNGALVGTPRGEAVVEGSTRALGDFTLVRFENLTVAPGERDGEVAYAGAGRFVLAGDSLYAEAATVGPAAFPLPVLSLVLWFLAAIGIVLGFTLRPFFPSHPADNAPPLRWTGFALHILGIVAGFLLWDYEVRGFLGTSILTMLFTESSGGSTAFGAILGLESLGFTLAFILFGLPVRFLANNALKLAGLKRARGAGKGLAYVAAWGLGAAYLPVLLNVFLGFLTDRLA